MQSSLVYADAWSWELFEEVPTADESLLGLHPSIYLILKHSGSHFLILSLSSHFTGMFVSL